MKKNSLIKVTLFMLPQLLFSFWSFGQFSIIQGTVTDETGIPLVGVNVVIEGTTLGTITDINGNYQIEAGAESTLTFSYVGYLSEKVIVGNQTEINIALLPDIMKLQDVVVVGYGTQSKETLTGSISKVDGEEISISPSVNLSTSLAGKLPGLIVNQRDGWPGREFLDIVIRGNATMDSDPDYEPGDDDDPNDPFDVINPNEPLVVIDGVPRDNLSRLNPEDIESITVLKDASAAIYGARGANGVILVTTKQGSKGAPVFNFSYSYAIHKPTKIPEMMDAATFAEIYNEAEWNRQGRPDTGYTPFFTDEAIQRYRDGSDPVLYPNTDWPGEVIKDYSYLQKVNLHAGGGSENTRYLLSLGYTDQDGNLKNNPTHYKQFNARARIDVDLTKSLSVGANMSAILNNRTYASQPVDFVGILQSNPTLVAVYPNGLIAPGRFRNNPLLIDRGGYDKTEDYPLYTTFTATYKVPFIKGLALDASYNYDLRNEFQKWYRTPIYYHEYNVETGEYDRMITDNPIELRDTYRKWTTSLFNFRVSYKTTIYQNHNISAMAGIEQQSWKFNWAQAYRKNFVSPAIPQIDAGSTDPEDKDNRGGAAETAYNNYFGRVNYDFKRKYLLEFVFRYDGSQVFPEGKRYGFFPAVSAGWRLSEENFISENLPFVSELKLRGSYGELGNDRVPQWQYLQSFQFGDNYVFGGSDAPGVFSSVLPNTNITWEVSKKLDYGLVAELWDGLLGTDLTVFQEKRSNILWRRNLSVSHMSGFPELPDENIGKVDNHGFELVLSHRNTIGDLSYSVIANTSFARSEIIFMDEVPPAEPYQTETGHPVGSGLYYMSDGIFNTQEELDSYPHSSNTRVGDIKILDLNGDSVINGDDRYRTNQSPIPEYVFGLTLNFQYKGFDLTLFFQGQTNAYSYDYTLTEFGEQDLDNNTVYRATNRWTRYNQEGATMPRSDSWEPGTTDFFLYDATFVRLKNAELGYRLPGKLISKIKLKDVRVFVNGTNLLTWAKEITWKDPELRSGDFTEYPPLRIINFGVNVEF